MGAKRSWWQKIKLFLLFLAVAILFLAAIASIITVIRLYGTGFAGKTLWDWLNLLGVLAIPIVVGLAACRREADARPSKMVN